MICGAGDKAPTMTNKVKVGLGGLGVLGVLGCLIIGGVIYFLLSAGPDPQTTARTLARQPECRRLLANFVRLKMIDHIVEGSDEVIAFVDGNQWSGQETKDRLAQTLTIYCAYMPSDGRLTVTVRDMTGQAVFRVRDGHVASWL